MAKISVRTTRDLFRGSTVFEIPEGGRVPAVGEFIGQVFTGDSEDTALHEVWKVEWDLQPDAEFLAYLVVR